MRRLTKAHIQELKEKLEDQKLFWCKEMNKELEEKNIEFLSKECYSLLSYRMWVEHSCKVSVLRYLLGEHDCFDVYFKKGD